MKSPSLQETAATHVINDLPILVCLNLVMYILFLVLLGASRSRKGFVVYDLRHDGVSRKSFE